MPSTLVTVSLDLEDIGLDPLPGVPLTVAPRTSSYLGASRDKALDLATNRSAVTDHTGVCSVSVIKSDDIVFGDPYYVVSVGNFSPFTVELNANVTVRELILDSTPGVVGSTEASVNNLIAQYIAEHGGLSGLVVTGTPTDGQVPVWSRPNDRAEWGTLQSGSGTDPEEVNRLITEALVSVRAAIGTNTSDISSLTTVVTETRLGLASLEGRFDAIAPDNSSLDSNERYLAAVVRGGNIVPYWDRSRQVPIAGRVGDFLSKSGTNDNDYAFTDVVGYIEALTGNNRLDATALRNLPAGGTTDATARASAATALEEARNAEMTAGTARTEAAAAQTSATTALDRTEEFYALSQFCLLYTSPSPRDS